MASNSPDFFCWSTESGADCTTLAFSPAAFIPLTMTSAMAMKSIQPACAEKVMASGDPSLLVRKPSAPLAYPAASSSWFALSTSNGIMVDSGDIPSGSIFSIIGSFRPDWLAGAMMPYVAFSEISSLFMA